MTTYSCSGFAVLSAFSQRNMVTLNNFLLSRKTKPIGICSAFVVSTIVISLQRRIYCETGIQFNKAEYHFSRDKYSQCKQRTWRAA